MKACQDYIDLISARLDGLLTKAQERELDAHLFECRDCRELAGQLSQLQASFPELAECTAPTDLAQGVMDKICAGQQPKKSAAAWLSAARIRGLAGLAACAVLCVGIYQSGLWHGNQASQAGLATPASEQAGAEVSSAPAAATGAPPAFDAADARSDQAADPFSLPEQDLSGGSDGGKTGGRGDEMDNGGVSAQNGAGDASLPGQSILSVAPSSSAEQDGDAGIAGLYVADPLTRSIEFEIAGQIVNAVLTLSALPEGAWQVLGEDVQWLTGEQGSICIITGAQMDQLLALAEDQGQDLSGSASNRIDTEQICALVLPEAE